MTFRIDASSDDRDLLHMYLFAFIFPLLQNTIYQFEIMRHYLSLLLPSFF
mgnify:CR=1 FL=1